MQLHLLPLHVCVCTDRSNNVQRVSWWTLAVLVGVFVQFGQNQAARSQPEKKETRLEAVAAWSRRPVYNHKSGLLFVEPDGFQTIDIYGISFNLCLCVMCNLCVWVFLFLFLFVQLCISEWLVCTDQWPGGWHAVIMSFLSILSLICWQTHTHSLTHMHTKQGSTLMRLFPQLSPPHPCLHRCERKYASLDDTLLS